VSLLSKSLKPNSERAGLSIVDNAALLRRNSATESVLPDGAVSTPLAMPHRPTQGTDSAKPSGPDRAKPENLASQFAPYMGPDAEPPLEVPKTTDLAEVAAKFAVHGAGKISAELSGELALDLVLNEIVEQVCLATGASGAAIALRRGDAIVCRATAGTHAPELGTRLDTGSGLSGACVRSGKIQSCEDAWNDDRANADLSRQLGVRSIVVYPLLRAEEFLGILEILSPLPSAFGARDLQMLEVLASRTVKNADAAREISLHPAVPAPLDSGGREEAVNGGNRDEPMIQGESPSATPAEIVSARSALLKTPVDYVVQSRSRGRLDWFTAVITVIIVAIALVMAAAFSTRVGWIKVSGHRNGHRRAPESASVVSTAVAARTDASATNKATQTTAPVDTKISPTQTKPVEKRESVPTPEGTLFVYEDGKEIFRMPSPSGHNGLPESKSELISRVEPEYPAQARAQHIQGTVTLRVRVATDGSVKEIKVASGDPLLAGAAVAAVRQWRFRPYILNGLPREAETEVTLRFTLPAN
jgi:TonB family protein